MLAQIDTGGLFQNMNWMQIGVLALVAYMFLTGKIKITDILKLLNPVPTPTPGPTPNPNPNPIINSNLIQLLLNLLTNAKATGNKQLEEAVTTVLPHCIECCTDPNYKHHS